MFRVSLHLFAIRFKFHNACFFFFSTLIYSGWDFMSWPTESLKHLSTELGFLLKNHWLYLIFKQPCLPLPPNLSHLSFLDVKSRTFAVMSFRKCLSLAGLSFGRRQAASNTSGLQFLMRLGSYSAVSCQASAGFWLCRPPDDTLSRPEEITAVGSEIKVVLCACVCVCAHICPKTWSFLGLMFSSIKCLLHM